jgi:hypothetical protein
VKASARFVSTVNRFGFGRSEVGRAATPSASRYAKGSGARSSRSPLPFAAGILASVALVIAVSAPSASAAPAAQPSYGALNTFGTGELLSPYGAFLEPVRNPLAVDRHGNIFAAEHINETVALFEPDPTLGGVLLGRIPTPGSYLTTAIAVDPVSDALYAEDHPGAARILRFLSDGNSPPTYTLDPGFSVATGGYGGLAVDPTTQDLLVAYPGQGAIKRFDASGALLATIVTPSVPQPEYVAAAPDGSIYISGSGTSVVAHLESTGVLIGEPIEVGGSSPIAVDPTTDNFVIAIGDRLKVFSPAGQQLSEAPGGSTAGIAIDQSGRLYAYDYGNFVQAYVPAVYPGVEAPSASGVTPTGVHVAAEVDPGEEPGGELPKESELCFQYMVVGAASWEPGPCQSLSGPETVQADFTGLGPNLDYVVRAKASNSLTFHVSDPVPFHTIAIPPKTTTNDPTDISETSAVLNGTINPLDLPATYHFEYGTTINYGSRVPAEIEAVAGADRKDRRVARTITGLQPGTTYHFRLVAQNAIGVSEGLDNTFTAAAAGAILRREYEQVSPVDKRGNAISEVQPAQAKADGSALAYINLASKDSAPLDSISAGFRGSDDWEGGISLDPPLSRTSGGILLHCVLATSADFNHTLVVTNRKLTSDAGDEGPSRANIYLVDRASGAYTFVATSPTGLYDFGGTGREPFVAGARDFSWVIFESPALREGDPDHALYRWSGSTGLELVSKLPDGEPVSAIKPNEVHPFARMASSDGSRIYFNVGAEVGNDNYLPGAGVYLWESGVTKAISIPHPIEEPRVPRPARLIGTGEDGRYAYFLSRSKLTSDAPDVNFSEASVYLFDADDESLKYLGPSFRGAGSNDQTMDQVPIAVSADGLTAYWVAPNLTATVWRNGALHSATQTPFYVQADGVSPDGRYLVYMDGVQYPDPSGVIYLYDAETEQTSCVTCLSDGSQGRGFVPEIQQKLGNQPRRIVTDSGQVFFTSPARLVAADVNGTDDVYEFVAGKNHLISPGDSPVNARFADASEDGDDVFFFTGQKLVGQDGDQSVDAYDARIGGGFANQSPPAAQVCLRDDCKATPGAGPELPFGGSEALNSHGNVKKKASRRCAKKRGRRGKHKARRCAGHSKPRRSASDSRRAHNDGRQG